MYGSLQGYRGKHALRIKPAERSIPSVTRPRLQRMAQHLFTDAHDPLRARASSSGIRKNKKKDHKGKHRCTLPPEDTVFIDISEDEADKETD
ncbi:hypothetical protein PsYK624_017770 [Phanerochaete sordida]|uniref:Uncharacterized protein n=1 Tax=Phanerochaete sordida TaxID=48140 RepID=A0A9P3FYQ6_9APHY|nr:hypothetical protein PsYK624_017770 [Phanerochaete sordida]